MTDEEKALQVKCRDCNAPPGYGCVAVFWVSVNGRDFRPTVSARDSHHSSRLRRALKVEAKYGSFSEPRG